MNIVAHVVGGACAGVVTSSVMISNPLSVEGCIASGILIGASMWGSLLPDVDHPESTFGKKIPAISEFISATGGHRGITHAPIIYVILLGLMLLVNDDYLKLALVVGIEYFIAKVIIYAIYKLKIIKKQYTLHLLFFLFMAFLTFKFNNCLDILYVQMIIGIFVGALSHIFMDSLTKGGTPWVYPFRKKKFRILKLKTGKDDGKGIAIVFALTIGFIYLTKFI